MLFRRPSIFFDIYTDFCLLQSVCSSVLTVTYCAFPFVFIATTLQGNHSAPSHPEPWRMALTVRASCLSSCTDDVLHPWQAFDVPYVYQSKCITSFDWILLWLSNRELQTHGSASPWLTRLLPSVFVKWLALFIKALDECVLCCGRDRGSFWVKPWSSQMHINRHLLWRRCFVCGIQLHW